MLDVRTKESTAGLDTLAAYQNFTPKVETIRRDLIAFLRTAQKEGKSVAGYGAAAKGNTLLNFCGINTDLIDFVVDRNPEKQDALLPGSHIPVFAPEKIWKEKPDYVLILPWNLASEISTDMSAISEWGGQFVVPVPEVKILS